MVPYPSITTSWASHRGYTQGTIKPWAAALVLLLAAHASLCAADPTSAPSATNEALSHGAARTLVPSNSSSQGLAGLRPPSSNVSVILVQRVGALTGRFAQQLLQRLQQVLQPSRPQQGPSSASSSNGSSTGSTDELPDFSSTANALAERAVLVGSSRAAALAQGALLQTAPPGSNDTTGMVGAAAAAQELQQVQEQAANSSAAGNSSSNSSSSGAEGLSGLQLLLRTIRTQWAAARSKQQQMQQLQQQQQQQSPSGGNQASPPAVDVGQQWVSGLDTLAATYPRLAAFARLARNSSVLVSEFSGSQLLPAVLLVPTNSALTDYLDTLAALAAAGGSSGGSDGSDGSDGTIPAGPGGSGGQGSAGAGGAQTWQQRVDAFSNNTSASTMLLRRHFLPARQPQLLDADGNINSQLLERGTNPLVFTSLVLRTGLGSYIQVSDLPPGPAAQQLAAVINPTRTAAAAAAGSSNVPPVQPLTANTINPGVSSNNTTNTNTSSSSSSEVRYLHVGQAGTALARPFLLAPTNTLVVPVDSVVLEGDEVINSATAARLRGAFGWGPEDEQALLSTVYLDPEPSYWSQTLGLTSGSSGSSSGGSGGNNGSGGSGNSGNSNGNGNGSSSSSGSSSDNGNKGSSGQGHRLRKLQLSSPAEVSPAVAPSNTSGSSAVAGSSDNSSSSSSSGNGGSSIAAAAAVAEGRARQQAALTQMAMADALAANLMTTEALGAWVTAAVLNPAGVFDPASLQDLPRVPAAATTTTSNSSSSSSSSSQLQGCWGGATQGASTASSGQSTADGRCTLVDWSSTCLQAPCAPWCNTPSSSSSCFQGPDQSAAAAQPTGKASSGGDGGVSLPPPGASPPGSCSRISTTWLSGLSPYQLYPTLGSTGAAPGSSSTPGAQQVLMAQGPGTGASSSNDGGGTTSSNSSSSSDASNQGDSGGTNANNSSSSAGTGSNSSTGGARRRGRRALRQSNSGNTGSGRALTSDQNTSSSSSSSTRSPSNNDLVFLPITQLSKLLSDGSLTPQQLSAAFSDRLRRYDSTLHTVVTFTDTLAATQAATATQALRKDNNSSSSSSSKAGAGVKSLLMGVPYGLKDLFAVPGYPTSWGLTALKNRTIDTPSWAFSALSGAAGGVLLAKTATGELAWGDTWFDNITTRNPWYTKTGSCGSSAGSAAAVAAGLLPYAIGSETWGSIVCPATTVGISAYRPSGGTIANSGILQVSPTLDKTGVFCRQLLDCALVADALMDTQPTTPTTTSSCCTTPQPSGNTSAAAPMRLYMQDPTQAAAFNYTQHQQQLKQQGQQQPPATSAPPPPAGSVFPASFADLPRLSDICIGYLPGTSTDLVSVLTALNPGCIKGPLPPPGDPHMVRDVLPTILQAEVAISFEGLWLQGLISSSNHWWPSLQLGQLAPAATYLRAQQLRGLLLQQTRQYFQQYGIHVLLKPARSSVGLDGLAALLDMPEVLLPVEMGTATTDDAEPVAPARAATYITDGPPGDNSSSSSGGGGGSSGASDAWVQPRMNSILALPGADAAAIAVGAAFQSVTSVHLQRPPLPQANVREAAAAYKG